MPFTLQKKTFPKQEILLCGVQKILMNSVGLNFWITFYLNVETVIQIHI